MTTATYSHQDLERWSRLCIWPLSIGWMALNAARLLQLEPVFLASALLTALCFALHLGFAVRLQWITHRARPIRPAITIHLDAPLAARWHLLAFFVGGLSLACAYTADFVPSGAFVCQWPQGCFVFGGLCWLFAFSHPIAWSLTLSGCRPISRQLLTGLALIALATLHFAVLL